MASKCTICGKERVVAKTYKEKVGTTYVYYREMICADPECQKKVEKNLNTEKAKRVSIKKEQDKHELERKEHIANSRRGIIN